MEYQGKVEKLNHQGKGILKLEGKLVFIDKVRTDEIVNYKIVKNTKKYYEAEVISYLEEINNQKDYNCCYYKKCGGCQIPKLSYEEQLIFKKEKVENILKKYCNIERKLEIIPNDNKFHYRNKVTFHVNNNKIGYYEEKSNNLIEIDKCLLADIRINKILNKIKNKLDLNLVNKIVIRTTNKEVMIIFYGKVNKEEVISLLKIYVDSVIVYDKKYRCIYGKDKIIENIKDLSFYISADSFFQVNSYQVSKLYDKVLEYANLNKNKRVIDLYCGTGTISLYLARYAKEVIGIEINKYAINDAIANAKLNNINNVKFINSDVAKINTLKADVLVVDPPRSGLDKDILKVILDSNISRLVYVSCDPMTLARDLNVLLEKYELKDITLCDMFSQSYHVESVVSLCLK